MRRLHPEVLGMVTWESDPSLWCTLVHAALPKMPPGTHVQRIEQAGDYGYTVWWDTAIYAGSTSLMQHPVAVWLLPHGEPVVIPHATAY